MNNRTYEDLCDWEKAFFNLNMKVGNNAWGGRLEADGSGGFRMRIFINNEKVKEKILAATSGNLLGHPIVFTVYSQSEYTKNLSERNNDRQSRVAKNAP